MIRSISVAALIFGALSISGDALLKDSNPTIEESLPAEVLGWESAPGERMVYDRETLYDYIDGGAELYLSYGLDHVVSRTYVRKGEPDLVVDVFDMVTSQNAFGVFSHSREVVESVVGQGSQYTEGLLLFWKGRYYVSILASPETEKSKKAVFALGRAIESAIPEEGPLPSVLNLLPPQGLVEESIRYFRHYIWLNSHYYVSDENILHIDDTTEAVLAKYKNGQKIDGEGGDENRILLVVQYPDEEAALSAYRDFMEHYLPDRNGRPAVRIEDGTWTACRTGGRVVAVVFNAPIEREALTLIESVLEGRKR
jgi:hypothetical protein